MKNSYLSRDREFKMDTKIKGPVICRQYKKEIKTEIHKYVQCVKLFHPSCMKLHKKQEGSELVPCKGKTEVFMLKSNTNVSDGAGESSTERKLSSSEDGLASSSTMNNKIEATYKIIKEIKSEIIGKDIIKKVITEAIDEEMNRVRQEIAWKLGKR